MGSLRVYFVKWFFSISPIGICDWLGNSLSMHFSIYCGYTFAGKFVAS